MDLQKQQIEHKNIIKDNVELYKKNIAVIDQINKMYNEKMADIIIEHEKKQFILYKDWKYEQSELQLTLETAINDFESIKDRNFKYEEIVRNQRSRITLKLLTMMNKYDTEIGSRYQILEELGGIYESDKLKKYVLQKQLNTFKREYSARIIQRWWRNLLEDVKMMSNS